ncbi:6,7-dimethyl-8-ribityllumazine synthase [Candidatus Micrarchaeota archaeon CG10_big_fil_rev_8_21_14_0_10_45_29]|nr:MAG: 6,7-dimethyl-8-ribityllumazine synthase [Candidatus Micrarchaeota archaeon CG10_big_fil_rev_8_21_14_0_10_45_29]
MAKKLAIIVSDFNDEITGKMERVAVEEAKKAGAQVVKAMHVPGAYDIPLIAKKMAERKDVDAIVALGAIIKGETGHDKVIAVACAKSLSEISLETGKPVMFGVIGPGATHEQAQKRAEGQAKRAVQGAIKMLGALKELQK